MALVLLGIGLILVVTAYEGTFDELLTLFGQDIPGYLAWGVAILIIGAIGYAPQLTGFSNALLALVFLVLFLANKGIYANAVSLATSPPTAAAPQAATSPADQAAIAAGPTISETGGTASSSTVSTAIGAIGGLVKLATGFF